MDRSKEFVFTPENLLDNLDKLGCWSTYGLASDALSHYFPEEYKDEDNQPSTIREIELVHELGLEYWEDVIRKYHTEIGWKEAFNPEAVNES